MAPVSIDIGSPVDVVTPLSGIRAVRTATEFVRVSARSNVMGRYAKAFAIQAVTDEQVRDELRTQLGVASLLTRDPVMPQWFTGVSAYATSLNDVPFAVPASQMRVAIFRENLNATVVSNSIRADTRPTWISCAFDYVPPDLIELLELDHVRGVVLGHYVSADVRDTTVQAWADTIDAQRAVVQQLSNKPVLLACSYQNVLMSVTPYPGWADAFEDVGLFDGYAIFNVHAFAWFEFNTAESVRTALHLPDKPLVLFEFSGSRGVTGERVRQMWQIKLSRLVRKLKKQEWSGLVLYATTSEGADMKAAALQELPDDERFVD